MAQAARIATRDFSGILSAPRKVDVGQNTGKLLRVTANCHRAVMRLHFTAPMH
jgi:hypothetical protein